MCLSGTRTGSPTVRIVPSITVTKVRNNFHTTKLLHIFLSTFPLINVNTPTPPEESLFSHRRSALFMMKKRTFHDEEAHFPPLRNALFIKKSALLPIPGAHSSPNYTVGSVLSSRVWRCNPVCNTVKKQLPWRADSCAKPALYQENFQCNAILQ